MTNAANPVDPTDDRQAEILRAKAWNDAANPVDPTDDRQAEILRAKAWSKPISKIIKKIKKKGKK
jgi:hypothetical protein